MKSYFKAKAATFKRSTWAYIITCFWLIAQEPCLAFAQSISPLNRLISIHVVNESPRKTLEVISTKGDFTFSYNPDLLKGLPSLSGNFENIAVKDVLEIMFKGRFDYKERENYVIITLRSQVPPKKSSASALLIISGQIIDAQTLAPLSEVSVYDRVTLSAAVSDKQGQFKLRIDKATSETEIAIVKRKYQDTVLYMANSGSVNLNIMLNQEMEARKPVVVLYDAPPLFPIEEDSTIVRQDSTQRNLTRIENDENVLAPEETVFNIPFSASAKTKQGINQRNITDDIYRRFQFSVVPYFGTNGSLSGNVINDYSLNLFGGVSKGTSKLEMSALFNIDLEDVKTAQFAGLFNVVGRDVSGIQAAGLFNVVGRDVTGIQMGGLFNVNEGEFSGVQLAGLLNVNEGSASGAQLAGLMNINEDTVTGWQGSGLMNINNKKVRGLQTAGLMNINEGGIDGAQFAGLMNLNEGDSDGAQFAGMMNLSEGNVKGSQISGLVNSARKVKGSQIGVVNLADSVSGIQLGFYSFSKKGYHKIEVFADEIFYTNLAFRTGGNHAFYNIFTAGLNPTYKSSDDLYWTFGYGIGTSPRLSKRFYLNFDITANQLSKGKFLTAPNNLCKLYTGLDFQLAKKFSINAGATLNVLIRDSSFNNYPETFTNYKPEIIFSEKPMGGPDIDMWIGFKAGIRFL